MRFLRPEILEAPAASSPKSCRSRRRYFGLLTLFSLTAPSIAQAKPFRAVGVKAWTSGSETFIRARPSADVPPVAKVKRHTPLYVWGKYNGWYRVETHDHIFGWVFNKYIEAPKGYKVRAMPADKARVASNRTGNQVMYGSPALLKGHYAAYGSPGALKGLRQQGIRVAVAPKPAAKAKVLVAKAAPSTAVKSVKAKTAAQKATAQKTLVAKTIGARPATAQTKAAIQIAAAPRPNTKSAVFAPSLRQISPVPSVEPIERRVRLAPVAKSGAKPAAKTVIIARAPQIKPQTQSVRVIAPAIRGKMNGFSAPRVEELQQNSAPARETPREAASAPRDVESARIAESARSLSPSARYFARAASQAALVPDTPRSSAISNSNSSDGPLTDGNFQPVPFKAPVSIAPVAPRVKISKPAIRKAAPKPAAKVAKKPAKKKVVRSSRSQLRAARREREREQLRARMGLTPAAPHSVIAPVSPAELMRARQQYLAERKARLGVPNSPAGEVPVVGIAPLPAQSGPLGGPSETLPPATPGEFAPMSYEPSNPLAPLLGDPYVLSLAQLKPKTAAAAAAAIGAGQVSTMPLVGASRGGSPRDRAAANRGGSPRDRFGSGMANQALSYRGMRYIRGAASPSRGFDCSGLIYFLLRQRGLNPPRTAAGYRNWGQGVPKGQLKSGDLVLFANTYKRGISHIGVYLGEGKFVHAATSATGVRVSSLNEAYYRGKYFGARRPK